MSRVYKYNMFCFNISFWGYLGHNRDVKDRKHNNRSDEKGDERH